MTKWQKFKQGIMSMTPEQQLKIQMRAHIGNIIGIIFGSLFLALMGYWYFSVAFSFIFVMAIILSFVSYIGTKQKYNAIKQAMDKINQLSENSFSELDINKEVENETKGNV